MKSSPDPLAFVCRSSAAVRSLLLAATLTFGGVFAQAQTLTEGPFYEATSERGTVYLFGTVHFGLPDFYPLSPRVYEALAASSELLVEADIANVDPALGVQLMAMMALPTGQELDAVLGETLWQRTVAVAQRNGLPAASFLPLRPWSAAMLLSLLPYQQMGLSPELGVDAHLLGEAAAREVAVVELESLQMQLGIFADLDEAQELDLLAKTIASMEDEQAREFAEETIAAWRAGDGDAIDRVVSDTMRKDTPALALRFLDERNQRMLVRTLEVLDDSARKTVMVAVGAAHLPGTGGLADLLLREGFAVVQR